MIDPISIAFLLAGAVVGAAVIIFWDEIRSFFIESYHNLPKSVQQDLQGVVVIAQAVDRAIIGASFKYYSYNAVTQHWKETVSTKAISADEVPDHIKNRLRQSNTVDITDEVAKELQLNL